jgi:hypothetical protein
MLGVLMSFALYNIPYSPTYTQGLMLGIILGMVLQHRAQASQGKAQLRHPGSGGVPA